jgi:hypothetical protein
MEFVTELDDILENIDTFEKYLQDPAKRDFAIGLVKEGTCFIAVKKEQGYSFYPSRFAGYKKNSYEAHLKRDKEGAKETIPSISQLLKHKPDPSKEMEMEYKQFCKDLGFTANDKGFLGEEHKYWTIAI